MISRYAHRLSIENVVNAVKDIRRDLVLRLEIRRKHLQVQLTGLHLQGELIFEVRHLSKIELARKCEEVVTFWAAAKRLAIMWLP